MALVTYTRMNAYLSLPQHSAQATPPPIENGTSDIKRRIKKIFAGENSAIEIQKVEGGFSNNIWRIRASCGSYIFRSPKKVMEKALFAHVLTVAKTVFKVGIGPEVVSEDLERQEMLLRYVENSPWPSYDETAEPYRQTMRSIRQFHDSMPLVPLPPKTIDYSPFSFIISDGKKLEISRLPKHFSVAIERLKRILQALTPWLEKHATLCHGDFHKGNVLLKKHEKGYKADLIDFDSLANGHPFFDVVKLSVALSHEKRLELFSAYLGHNPPTKQELAHFELLDLALLMVVAVVRFKSAINAQSVQQPGLSKEELEHILNSPEPLPSFLSVTFKDTSPEARQKGALYALSEFLNKTNEPIFTTLLSTV
jgi:thiamine kinase-like enzyme